MPLVFSQVCKKEEMAEHVCFSDTLPPDRDGRRGRKDQGRPAILFTGLGYCTREGNAIYSTSLEEVLQLLAGILPCPSFENKTQNTKYKIHYRFVRPLSAVRVRGGTCEFTWSADSVVRRRTDSASRQQADSVPGKWGIHRPHETLTPYTHITHYSPAGMQH